MTLVALVCIHMKSTRNERLRTLPWNLDIRLVLIEPGALTSPLTYDQLEAQFSLKRVRGHSLPLDGTNTFSIAAKT